METIVFIFSGGDFIPAGRLLFEDLGNRSKSTFAYGREYLKKSNAVPLDPISLPLEMREFSTPPDFQIFNAIRDAGPDKWGRYLLSKRFGRELNELENILGLTPERVGSLAFGPTIERPQRLGPKGFEPYRSDELDLKYSISATDSIVAEEDNEKLERLLNYGPSLGGARPKIALMWNGRPSIAKFSISFDARNEPLIEYAAMSLAKAAGLQVPDIFKTKINERDVYIIERFDRSPGTHRPLQYLSGLSATGLHEQDYGVWSYAHLCEAITKLCDNPVADKKELFGRMVFNILINNDDDHMRNHAFIRSEEGKWRLSKLYDVVPRNQLSSTFRLAMNVGKNGKEASKSNALSACRYFQLDTKEALEIWEKIEQIVMKNWRKTFRDAGLTKNEVDVFSNSISLK